MPVAPPSVDGIAWALWIHASRPRTLTMAVVPVILGAALPWARGAEPAFVTFGITLLCAAAIQIGTNLFNDANDGARGADGPERIGPLRLTGAGLATPRQVRRAALACFGVALLGGLHLVYVGGLPILAIGLAALAAGYAYSGGPRPLSHGPWGELYVIAFFGVIAVGGTAYLQTGRPPGMPMLLTGFAIGCYAAAVLLVNNVRDTEADRKAGRRTLAGRLGASGAQRLYGALVLAPLPILSLAWGPGSVAWVWLGAPACAWLAILFLRMPVGPAMNAQLGRTALAQVLVAGLLILERLP